jgi:hypothetical protein
LFVDPLRLGQAGGMHVHDGLLSALSRELECK